MAKQKTVFATATDVYQYNIVFDNIAIHYGIWRAARTRDAVIEGPVLHGKHDAGQFVHVFVRLYWTSLFNPEFAGTRKVC